MGMREQLESLLAAGQDNPLLRFTLGSQLLKTGELDAALVHLAAAVQQDPGYSAAWKLYGKALHEAGDLERSASVYRQGIEAAENNGDLQAVREMQVFLKRVEKAIAGPPDQ